METMNVEKLWNLVLNGGAVAVNPIGCAICGSIASQYSKQSEWTIIVGNDIFYIDNGKIVGRA